MYFDDKLVFCARPLLHGDPARLVARLYCTGSGDEEQAMNQVSGLLRHDRFQDIFLELARGGWKTESHLDDGAFLREIEIHGLGGITTHPPLAIVVAEGAHGTLLEFPHERVCSVVPSARP